jgi:hypothetical protein
MFCVSTVFICKEILKDTLLMLDALVIGPSVLCHTALCLYAYCSGVFQQHSGLRVLLTVFLSIFYLFLPWCLSARDYFWPKAGSHELV